MTPIVLTGGIGSGKSTVARLLAERGFTVVEADRIGHEVLAPGGEAFAAVAARWPGVVVDGAIDRRALGRIVFGDPSELEELEAITHPPIREAVLARVRAASGPIVVEVPIPVGWLPSEWPVVVVDVPDPIRISRLLGRGLAEDEIADRMAAQPTRSDWVGLADHVVGNEGDESDLARAVDRLLSTLT